MELKEILEILKSFLSPVNTTKLEKGFLFHFERFYQLIQFFLFIYLF
jgi:hypothetical protein